MRSLFLMARLAFICNLFFLTALSFHFSNWLLQTGLMELVLIAGFLLSFIANPVSNVMQLLAFGKGIRGSVPNWLVWTNFAFLLLQLSYIIYRIY